MEHLKQVGIRKKHQISFRRWLKGIGTGGQVKGFIGAELFFVKEWIEKKFSEGMNWENYGSVWVVDHIVPVMLFDVTNKDDLKICWHYKNLMPLFKQDNLKKEGNIFFAFELLSGIKNRDFFYEKLFQRVLPEVRGMVRYLEIYSKTA